MHIRAHHSFSLESSAAAAAAGKLEEWVQGYLRGPGGNLSLAEGLIHHKHFWAGPMEIPVAELEPTTGPGRHYHEHRESWIRRISSLIRSIRAGEPMPPLIGEWFVNRIKIMDGNHRHDAYHRLRIEKAWVIVAFKAEHELEEFKKVRQRIATDPFSGISMPSVL